jgi:hypothetical protein
MFVIVDVETVRIRYVGIFKLALHTKFQMHISNGSLVITVKRIDKYRVHDTFYTLKGLS